VNPRELITLKNSLVNLPRAAEIIENTENTTIKRLAGNFMSAEKTAAFISKAIADEPGALLTEGGIIKTGYSAEVDKLRKVISDAGILFTEIETKLKTQTNINQMKVAFNRVFGYYIEVPRGSLKKVPEYFERRQTMVNAERFVTEEIKDLENKVLGAEESLNGVEYELFCNVRDIISRDADKLRELSKSVAELDLYLSLAAAAQKRGYARPTVDDGYTIEFSEARHPTVEVISKDGYVANDLLLDNKANRLALITGPNMSGKSTYIRLAALVTIMAQMGSFVPAKSAHIGMADRIFTRVGASDNISYGRSTFMVEMVETANILTHATERSLIVLDEIGRGTSTYDGISIAWAVAEYILNRIRARTLFATHYHELAELEGIYSGVKNLTIDVKESGDELIFMHKITPGSADRSYGIYVAKLAGLPNDVIERANSVLSELENPKSKRMPKKFLVQQLLIFDEVHPAVTKLREMDIDTMTPLKAIEILGNLKELAAVSQENR
jgi:DNA mismatch repair protein MutS